MRAARAGDQGAYRRLLDELSRALRAATRRRIARTGLTGVDAEDVVALEADLFGLGLEPEMWHYPGVGHWFAEEGVADAYDADAAALAWDRTVEFLRGDRSHQS